MTTTRHARFETLETFSAIELKTGSAELVYDPKNPLKTNWLRWTQGRKRPVSLNSAVMAEIESIQALYHDFYENVSTAVATASPEKSMEAHALQDTMTLPAVGCYVEVRALWGKTRRAYVIGHRGSDTMKLGSITGVDASNTAHKNVSYLVKVVRGSNDSAPQTAPQAAPPIKAAPTTAEIVAAVLAALGRERDIYKAAKQ